MDIVHAVESLLRAEHSAPFDLLGPHQIDNGQTVIRAIRPTAQTLTVTNDNTQEHIAMSRLRDEGVFEATISGEWRHYHYEAVTHDGRTETFADPYTFPFILTDYDLYLLG